MYPHLKILKQEYRYRQSRNSGYSMRAFARDLQLSPSTLSEIFSGKKGISTRSARAMSKRLKLRDQDLQIFLLSVGTYHARSQAERTIAKTKLGELVEIAGRDTPKTTTVVSWVAEAVLKLSQQDGFEYCEDAIASRLGVAPYEVRFAWGFLMRLGFIENTSPSKAFLAFLGAGKRLNIAYEQLLDRARQCIDSDDNIRSDFSNEPLLLQDKDLPTARDIIANCIEDLRRLERRSAKQSRLHYFTSQLISIEQDDRQQSQPS